MEEPQAGGSFGSHSWLITPKGWERVEGLKVKRGDSSRAFIAMWFDKSLNRLYEDFIRLGIGDAGYNAFRIDRHDHNNRIDDEILANIRTSRFLVADFTENRGGVYFEAGFALGLGLPVVWLCREADLKKVHFDTRQYNFIGWEPDRLGELRDRLKNRIVATIGQGPIPVDAKGRGQDRAH